MAQGISCQCNGVQSHQEILLQAMAKRLNEERKRADSAETERDLAEFGKSQAQRRQSDLERQMSAQRTAIQEMEMERDGALTRIHELEGKLREEEETTSQGIVEIKRLQGELNKAKHRADKRTITKRKAASRKAEEKRNSDNIVKQEICDLQTQIDNQEEGLIAKDSRISELSRSVESLKAEKATFERTRAQLTTAQTDIAITRAKLRDTARELQAAHWNLTTIQLSVATLSSYTKTIETIANHLKAFSKEAPKVCDPNHDEYRYLTDCGTLLCSNCLQQTSSRDRGDMIPEPEDPLAFDMNCLWCCSDFWTWQTLAVPYSNSWIAELDALSYAIHQLRLVWTR